MNRIAKSLVLLSAVAAAGSANADFGDVCPYVGIDYYHAWMKGKNFTRANGNVVEFSRLLPKSYPGVSLYIGAKFHEYFGLEFGVETSTTKSRTLSDSDKAAFGIPSSTAAKFKVRRSGAHLDLVGTLPLNECFDLLGFVGWGWIKPKVSFDEVDQSGDHTITPASAKGKSVARVAVGASYLITDTIGLRAKLGWEGTSVLKVNTVNMIGEGSKVKLFKDSMTASIGAFVKF